MRGMKKFYRRILLLFTVITVFLLAVSVAGGLQIRREQSALYLEDILQDTKRLLQAAETFARMHRPRSGCAWFRSASGRSPPTK